MILLVAFLAVSIVGLPLLDLLTSRRRAIARRRRRADRADLCRMNHG